MFGDLKKIAADAKLAVETLTILNDRLEALVVRFEASMAILDENKENI